MLGALIEQYVKRYRVSHFERFFNRGQKCRPIVALRALVAYYVKINRLHSKPLHRFLDYIRSNPPRAEHSERFAFDVGADEQIGVQSRVLAFSHKRMPFRDTVRERQQKRKRVFGDTLIDGI